MSPLLRNLQIVNHLFINKNMKAFQVKNKPSFTRARRRFRTQSNTNPQWDKDVKGIRRKKLLGVGGQLFIFIF